MFAYQEVTSDLALKGLRHILDSNGFKHAVTAERDSYSLVVDDRHRGDTSRLDSLDRKIALQAGFVPVSDLSSDNGAGSKRAYDFDTSTGTVRFYVFLQNKSDKKPI